jgi:hypothetical protein
VNTRKKGVLFEREVAAAFEAAGFEVRGLESGGDHLVVQRDGYLLHLEAKRREHLKVDTWLRQQEADCPAGVRRALVFRLSRRPAYAIVPLEQLVAREAEAVRLRRAATEARQVLRAGGASVEASGLLSQALEAEEPTP